MTQIPVEIKQNFLAENHALVETIKKNPQQANYILGHLSITKDTARILGFDPVYKLYQALESVYKGICDKKISHSENLVRLILLVADKIAECCKIIDRSPADLEDVDILQYLLYCDKAVANEIFDVNVFTQKSAATTTVKRNHHAPIEAEDKLVQIHTKSVNTILTAHEEMIARTYKMNNQLDELKLLHDKVKNPHLMEIQRLLLSDLLVLQNALLLAHDQVVSLIKDNSLVQGHMDLQGFFIYANEQKYLIPSKHIVDIINEAPSNYVTMQNQRYFKRGDEEEGDEIEYIPIYSLSSLFPGQKAVARGELDTILIAEFGGQQIGMVIDAVQRFVYVVKKPMPSCFRNFTIFQGVAFDEKYDMVPVLSVPEIMRRFRSQRNYDVKKFEANTMRRVYKILVVDDSETTRQIERVILEGNDFLVEQAVDGINALEMARTKQYDLILTDDVMPRMNGATLLDNLRHLENYAHVPVVAMAAKPIDSADAFISKADFKRSELIRIVKELLHE